MFKRFVLGAILPAFFLLWGMYNIALMVNGPEGQYVQHKYSQKKQALEQDLVTQQNEQAALANRLQLLSRDSLDMDLLDENARKTLKYADKEEMVITLEELDRLISSRKSSPN